MKRIMCSTLGVAALESSSSSVSAIWEQFVHKFLKTFLVVKKKKKKKADKYIVLMLFLALWLVYVQEADLTVGF